MKTRIEKNRKHFATLIAAILGTAIMLAVNQVWALPSQMIATTIWAALAVLVVRSAVIESGVRRPANGFEKNLDRVGSEIVEKHFGVVALPPEPKGDAVVETKKKTL